MRRKSKSRIIVTSLLENLAVWDEGTRSSRSHRNLIARLHGHLGVIVTSLRVRLHGRQGVILTSLLENPGSLDEVTRSSRFHHNLSLDKVTRSSRVHRNLIARLHGHQGVIVTSLLENRAVWMRLHGHQGIIVTSLDEGTRSSRVHRNLTAGKPGSLEEVTSSSRSQGKQRKQQKTETKVLTTKLGGTMTIRQKVQGADSWSKSPRRYDLAAPIFDASSTAVRQG